MQETNIIEEVEQYNKYYNNPFLWIEDYFGMGVQEVLPEYEKLLLQCRKTGDYNDMKLYMFRPFTKYKMLTRQQAEIFHSIKSAVNGEKQKKISIRSGHGIGKSSGLSIILLWFLYTRYRSIVGCTAPTADQLYDVLRKELAIWINKLPKEVRRYFNWTSRYIRIKDPDIFEEIQNLDEDEFEELVEGGENEEATRFARARTATKDKPEALAGLHADDLALIVDEASGVDDAVFNSSKGALTNDNTLLILISNPTRVEGYFYNSHNSLASTFQTLHFNSEESPIVGEGFIEDIILEHGEESDEYKIRVKGEFPDHGEMDDEGRIDLFNLNTIDFIPDVEVFNPTRMGIDPSKGGIDNCPRACRDDLALKIVAEKKINTEKGIANTTITLLHHYNGIATEDVVYDNFGVGANVGNELGVAGYRCIGVNGNDPANNPDRFENIRAEMYWRFAQRIKQGGQLVGDKKYREDLKMIKYKRNGKGKIQIISKEKMKKRYGKSPDRPDAGAYTFFRAIENKKTLLQPAKRTIRNPNTGKVIEQDEFDNLHNKKIQLW